MFRLPNVERIDPMEEKRQARENTINSLITFFVLCAAIRAVVRGIDAVNAIKAYFTTKPPSTNPCGY